MYLVDLKTFLGSPEWKEYTARATPHKTTWVYQKGNVSKGFVSFFFSGKLKLRKVLSPNSVSCFRKIGPGKLLMKSEKNKSLNKKLQAEVKSGQKLCKFSH